MGNNQEIRERMESYRKILLVLNWICAIVLFIVGIVLVNFLYIEGIGIGVIIGSVVIGIIGHFLINVTLAIPFILLNNGDILESMKGEKMVVKPIENQKNSISRQKFDYKTNKAIYLFSQQDLNSTIITTLPENTNLLFLEKGNDILVDSINAPWYKIKSERNEIGWCFSGYLNKA